MLRLFALAGLAMTVLARLARSRRRRRTPRSTPSPISRSGRCWPRSALARCTPIATPHARTPPASTCSSASTGRTSSSCSAPGPTRRRSRRTSAGDAAKKLNDKLATMLASPTDTRQHNGLSVAPAKAGKDAIFAVTHVDVIPPEKDNGANALEQLADGSRRHAGNLQFDVWRQTNRPNHFTVVEAWANRGAFDVHRDAEGDARVPHEARADVGRALRRAALQGRSYR